MRVVLHLCFLEFRWCDTEFLYKATMEVGPFHSTFVGYCLYRILRITLHQLDGVVEAEAVDVCGERTVGIRLEDG